MIHELHRQHMQIINGANLRTICAWLDLPAPRSWLAGWNSIAAAVGLPERAGTDTITAEEWNHAVDMALARHA